MPMSNEEVGQLVARLSMNVEDFLAANKKVQDELHKTHGMLEKLGHRAAHFSKEFAGDVANRLLGGIGIGGIAGGAATGFVHLMEESIEAAEKYERANIKMNATLAANGRDVSATTKFYHEQALELEKTTELTFLQGTEMFRLAESYRLTGDAAVRATRDAAALSAVTGHSAEGMLRVTAAVEEGNLKQAMAYGRMIPQLRGIRDEEKFLIEYNKQVEAGLRAQAALAETAGHKWGLFKEKVEEAKAGLGDILLEASFNSRAGRLAMQSMSGLFGLAGYHAMNKPPEVESGEPSALAGMWGGVADKMKVYQTISKASAKDVRDRIDELKIEARVAEEATEAEKERAKAIARGILYQPGGKELLDQLDSLNKYNAAAKEMTALKKQAGDEIMRIGRDIATIGMHEAEKTIYDMQQKIDEFRIAHPEDKGQLRRMEGEKAQQAALAYQRDAAKIIDEQKTPQEKFNREVEYLLTLRAKELLTQEQLNKEIEIQREKILGVVAAARPTQSAFSAQASSQAFHDLFQRPPVQTQGGQGLSWLGPLIAAVNGVKDAVTDPVNGAHFVFVDSGD